VSWRDDAACNGTDPEIFFPTRGADVAAARAICSTCPVFDPCWQAGLYEKFGIWAGTSERERRRIRRRLGIVLAEPEDPTDHPLTDLEDIA
jgi:WhiB family redox-sensing transcriptional regulator